MKCTGAGDLKPCPPPLGQRARHKDMERYTVPMDARLEDFNVEGVSDIAEVDNEDSSTPILIFGAEDALTSSEALPAPDSSAQSSTIGGSTCLDQPWTVANVPDSSECGDRLLGASRKRSQRPPRRVPRRPTRGATASATYPRSQRARMNQSYPLDHTEH